MIVRVTMRELSGDRDRLRFDISVGTDMLPFPDIAYFGYSGPFRGDVYSAGVLLTADGHIELGFQWDENNRFHKTNLLSKKQAVGQYATVWWNFDSDPYESTYVIEAVTQLSAVTDIVSFEDATQLQVQSIDQVPRLRARVAKSFDIHGYDNKVYRPPVGVEGDLARLQGTLVFSPDHAVAGNGEIIMTVVSASDLELIPECFGPNLGIQNE